MPIKKYEYIGTETSVLYIFEGCYANVFDISISRLSLWNSNDVSSGYYYHHANSEKQSVRQ